ncbi:MAG: hypothetical protein FJX66_02530 [Alphaproteobacteria bacterium]|nr:hypothetical protein [Alphaproteobacteria bacterium]
MSWFVLFAAGTVTLTPQSVAAEDVSAEAGVILGEWNDLFFGFSYFSPDDDTGDHATVTPFKTELDPSGGVLRWSVHSVSGQADMKYTYEFPLSDLRRTTLETAEFCGGCEKIPQGTAVHSIYIECAVDKDCVRYAAHQRVEGDWRPYLTDELRHFVIDCPAESCGSLEEKLKAMARLYRVKRSGS